MTYKTFYLEIENGVDGKCVANTEKVDGATKVIEFSAYEYLLKVLDDIDKNLQCPAAEYVPTISEVFDIIDKAKIMRRKR